MDNPDRDILNPPWSVALRLQEIKAWSLVITQYNSLLKLLLKIKYAIIVSEGGSCLHGRASTLSLCHKRARNHTYMHTHIM